MSDGDASLNVLTSVSLKSPADTIQVFQVAKNYFGFKVDYNKTWLLREVDMLKLMTPCP